MRLGDLQEHQTQAYEESLRDRLKNVFQNVASGLSGSGGGGNTNIAQAAGSIVGDVQGAVGKAKQGLRSGIDAFKKGVDGGEMKALTAKERSVYGSVDRYLKALQQIINKYQRAGVQVAIPTWNPGNRSYMGRMTIQDDRFDKDRMQAIFDRGMDPTPQAQRSRQDTQVAAALKELKAALNIIAQSGGIDQSKVVDDGVEIRFNMGQNQEVLKSAVKKLKGIDVADNADDEQIEALSPEDLGEAIRKGRVDPMRLPQDKQEKALATIGLVNNTAPLPNQLAALAVVQLIDNNENVDTLAKGLQIDNVAPGVDFNALGKAIGLTNAKRLLASLGGDPPKKGMTINQAMDLVQTALVNDQIQNISDLDKMDDAKLAIAVERARAPINQLSDKQVNRLLQHYKFPNPSSQPKYRMEQLALAVLAKNKTLQPEQALQALRNNIVNIEQLKAINPSNQVLQAMVRAAGKTIQDADRDAVLQQLAQVAGKQAKTIDWKDPEARQEVDPEELVRALSDGRVETSDLTPEEIENLFRPSPSGTSGVDGLSINILSEVMPEVIDKGYLKINDATNKQLRGYLQGKGFKERMSGNLAGLRQQAKDLYVGEKVGSISGKLKKRTIKVLQELLKSDGESYTQPPVQSAINRALKDVQGDDVSLQRFLKMDEEDQVEELAKMARTIYYKRSGGAPSSQEVSEPTDGPVDPKTRRSVNDANTVLERIKKAKKDSKQELLKIADEMVQKGEKPGTEEFTSKLVALYRKKFP